MNCSRKQRPAGRIPACWELVGGAPAWEPARRPTRGSAPWLRQVSEQRALPIVLGSGLLVGARAVSGLLHLLSHPAPPIVNPFGTCTPAPGACGPASEKHGPLKGKASLSGSGAEMTVTCVGVSVQRPEALLCQCCG